MRLRWLFIAAYMLSGIAGLIYQVSWTRLLTLHMGHTTAAASTVVAAFMGGLARRCGRWWARCVAADADPGTLRLSGFESMVACIALALPYRIGVSHPASWLGVSEWRVGILYPADTTAQPVLSSVLRPRHGSWRYVPARRALVCHQPDSTRPRWR